MYKGMFVLVQVFAQCGGVVRWFGGSEGVVELEVDGCVWVLEVGEWLNDHASGLLVVVQWLEWLVAMGLDRHLWVLTLCQMWSCGG